MGAVSCRRPIWSRFAEGAVAFDHAYTTTPLCTPYRACLLTGKYPSQTGVRHNGERLPAGCRTLADELNEAGYDTRYIGKWHLSGEPHGNRYVPPGQRGGFRHFIGWESHHVDHYKGLIWRDDPDTPIALTGHETDGLTDIVCEELRKVSSSETPFFMAVSYQAPHAPSSPPEPYYRLYDDTAAQGPENTHADALL
jgi:arylsulfatase A-like enzyme